MRTISIKANIPENHKLMVDIPEDLPIGPADVVVVIVPEIGAVEKRGETAGDILKSPLLGMWKDRKDITDSLEFARKLREHSETRKEV